MLSPVMLSPVMLSPVTPSPEMRELVSLACT
jgi:hypothetical protein